MPAIFYPVNDKSSIGGPARIILAPSTAAHPAKISDVVSLTTYALTAPWVDIGSTKTGLNIGSQSDVNQWENQQEGRYRVVPVRSEGTVATDALEYTQANRVQLMNAFADTDSVPAGPGQEHKTNFPVLTSIKQYRLAALHVDQIGLVHMAYFPNAQWSGSNIQEMFERGTQLSIPIQFSVKPDNTLIDPATSMSCFRVDFDQY